MLFLRRAASLASSAKDTPRGGIGFPERLMLVALALESLPVQERKRSASHRCLDRYQREAAQSPMIVTTNTVPPIAYIGGMFQSMRRIETPSNGECSASNRVANWHIKDLRSKG